MGEYNEHGTRYTPGFRFDQIEWCDDERELERERKRKDKKVRKRHKRLAKLIAADLLEMRTESFEENERKFRERQAKSAKVYAAKLAAAFRTAVEAESKWRELAKAKVAQFDKNLEKMTMRLERQGLLRRGIVRGRRR